jgi:peptidoglycan/xylan/chitin deacetylase (PgdA/CDA1 family)
MLTRLVFIPLFVALSLPTCKKGAGTGGNTSSVNSGATPMAAASPKATPIPTPAKPVVDQNAEVVVFGYHRFVKKVHRPDTEITPEAFEAQMKELKDKGIAVIRMQDFLAWKRSEKSIPPKCAIITFDDGWKSQLEVAWPIMKKFGYPLTLFIYTEGIRGGHFGGGEAMSWEQLAELRDAGVDIEAHSETHQDLRKAYDKVRHKKLSPTEYDVWLDDEIAGSKKTLEQKLGIRVTCFAFPFGYHNEHVEEIAKKAGYEALFTVYGQKLTYGTPLDSLGRYMIEGNKPKVFETAINFGGTSEGGSVPTAEVGAASLGVQPAEGATAGSRQPNIRANLAGFGQFDPGSVVMRLSGRGIVSAKFDAATKNIAYQPDKPLEGDSCTVIIEAKSGDKRISTTWTFLLSPQAVKAKDSPAPSIAPKKP